LWGEKMVTAAVAIIRRVHLDDREEWLRMRRVLWPDSSASELDAETKVSQEDSDSVVFVAQRGTGGLCGFLEAAIRPCTVNGELGRIGYVEGWFVDSDVRGMGVGRSLISAAEQWALEQRCEEIHSDTQLTNELSQLVHRQLGYAEVERLVHYRKRLV
jgi:aminoglycoside 6'-N-acetyltransferase I